jgi:hypothetical protein
MAWAVCLVCPVSSVSACHKNGLGRCSISSGGHITKLEQCTLSYISMGQMNKNSIKKLSRCLLLFPTLSEQGSIQFVKRFSSSMLPQNKLLFSMANFFDKLIENSLKKTYKGACLLFATPSVTRKNVFCDFCSDKTSTSGRSSFEALIWNRSVEKQLWKHPLNLHGRCSGHAPRHST